MEKIKFELSGEYIELIKLLKLLSIAESGAMAKTMVDNGEVMLNDQKENRKRAKLRKGDVIRIFDLEIKIE